MLTLVAVVLAYDLARETCDLLSSMVEVEDAPRAICLLCSLAVEGGVSLNERS